jgi:RNA polymerase sigma-70 factor, ECF subfamily
MRTSDAMVIGPSAVRARQSSFSRGRGRCGGRLATADTRPPEAGTEDADRMRNLYDYHAAALRRFATRLTGDRARAEDVVQETLLRAWQHPEIVDDAESSARAWLFTVARNIIIDDRRTARFRNEISSLDGSAPESAGPDDATAALDRLLIAEALARLSPGHRAVVQRAYYLGWTTAHIANDLHIPEGTVKSRLHHALASLRRVLREMDVTR